MLAHNQVIITSSGYCLLNGSIIPESIQYHEDLQLLDSYIVYEDLGKEIALAESKEAFLIIHTPGIDDRYSFNIFNWLIHCLPRLIPVYSQLPDLTLLIPIKLKDNPIVQASLLSYPFKRISYLPKQNVRVPNLIVPPVHPWLSGFDKEGITHTRTHFIEWVKDMKIKSIPRNKHVFFLPVEHEGYEIINIPEITRYLFNEGFEIIDTTQHGFYEIISLLQTAEIVISFQSHELAYSIFLQERKHVIELKFDKDYNEDYYKDRYETLCVSLNISYKKLYAFHDSYSANYVIKGIKFNISEINSYLSKLSRK